MITNGWDTCEGQDECVAHGRFPHKTLHRHSEKEQFDEEEADPAGESGP